MIKFIYNKLHKNGKRALNTKALSKLKSINARLPQDRILTPTLFNVYTSEIILTLKDVQVPTYADDITIKAYHINIIRPTTYPRMGYQ